MLILLFLSIILCLNTVNSNTTQRKFCPPPEFVRYRRNKYINSTRTAIITEVHGQKVQTGLDWGIFVHGELVSRYLYHHIAIIGFDHVFINCIYNATVHTSPPTLYDIYPHDESCTADWNDLGMITWRTTPYAGPVSEWPINPDTNQPDLDKDLYKNLRGINPIYNEIKRNKSFDWVLVIDMDEMLLPVHWKPKKANWCQQSNHPTLLDLTLGQMMITATTRYLYEYDVMNASRSIRRDEPCKLGESTKRNGNCGQISSFMMPAYFWTNMPVHSERTDILPRLRFRFPSAYENDLRQHGHATQEWSGGYQTWKSLHRVAHSPYLTGIMSMHQGGGNKVLAPRRYHGGLSLEVAHVKRNCPDECEKILIRDHKIVHLFDNYEKCIGINWDTLGNTTKVQTM